MFHLKKLSKKLTSKIVIILLLFSYNIKSSENLLHKNILYDNCYNFILNWYKKFVKDKYCDEKKINQYYSNAQILKDTYVKMNTQTAQGSLLEFIKNLSPQQLKVFEDSWNEAKAIRFCKKVIYQSTKKI